MTELDQLIAAAFASEGKQEQVNKVYLKLLKTTLFLPTRKQSEPVKEDAEPFIPLFTQQDDHYFIPVFDSLARLEVWIGEHAGQIDFVELKGWDIVRGLGEHVYLCLNFGTPYYKEFSPDEVKRLKTIVQRLTPENDNEQNYPTVQ